MKKQISFFKMVLILGFVGAITMTQIAVAQNCDAALSQGLMTTVVINSSQDSKSSFEKWLCTAEFSTHQQARDAGIGVGVPVYDIPLKLTGSFSSKERSEWKKSHCEGQTSSSQYSSRLEAVLHYVNPVAFAAWSECKRTTSYGVLCWFETPDRVNAVFKAKWNPLDGDRGRVPVVTSSSLVGASTQNGVPLLAIGSRLSPPPAVALARTDPKSSIVGVVNTTRGSCASYSTRQCSPKYENQWFKADESGRPYYEVFQVWTENRHGRGDIIASGKWSLTNQSGRISDVTYSCAGYPCGWSYHPSGGYDKSVEIAGDGKSFTWARKWDGDPALETYKAFYEVQRTVCTEDCDCQ